MRALCPHQTWATGHRALHPGHRSTRVPKVSRRQKKPMRHAGKGRAPATSGAIRRRCPGPEDLPPEKPRRQLARGPGPGAQLRGGRLCGRQETDLLQLPCFLRVRESTSQHRRRRLASKDRPAFARSRHGLFGPRRERGWSRTAMMPSQSSSTPSVSRYACHAAIASRRLVNCFPKRSAVSALSRRVCGSAIAGSSTYPARSSLSSPSPTISLPPPATSPIRPSASRTSTRLPFGERSVAQEHLHGRRTRLSRSPSLTPTALLPHDRRPGETRRSPRFAHVDCNLLRYIGDRERPAENRLLG